MKGNDIPCVYDYSFELSCGIPALKAWMSIRERGLWKFGRLIQQDINQDHYLASITEDSPYFELALPVSLNLTCFCYWSSEVGDADLDKSINRSKLNNAKTGLQRPQSPVFGIGITCMWRSPTIALS